MNESKNELQYDARSGRSLYFSFSLILFAGLIIGSTLEPWKVDPLTRYLIILFGASLFVWGFIVQRKREKKIEKETKEQFSELRERIEKLEKLTGRQ